MGRHVNSSINKIIAMVKFYTKCNENYLDFLGSAFIKALEAEQNFDETKEIKFSSFANKHIMGGIMDCRSIDRGFGNWHQFSRYRDNRIFFIEFDDNRNHKIKDSETMVIEKEFERKIENAIRELPFKQLIATWLYYYKELSQIEIADKLGISYSRVSQLLTLSRASLSKKLFRKGRSAIER